MLSLITIDIHFAIGTLWGVLRMMAEGWL